MSAVRNGGYPVKITYLSTDEEYTFKGALPRPSNQKAAPADSMQYEKTKGLIGVGTVIPITKAQIEKYSSNIALLEY